MSRSLGTLTLDLIARVGGFTQGMEKASKTAVSRSKEIERAAQKIRNSIASAFAGIGLGMLTRSIIQETAKAQNELAQLDAVLRSTGEAAGYSRGQLVSMASEFAKVSVESSGSIIDAQTALLSYSSIVGEQFPAALQAAIDQSARLGISLRQSAEIIGRALETPSRGVASLTRQGFAFTDQQRKLLKQLEETGRLAEAQAIVLDVLGESYDRAGIALRETLGGALAAVNNAFKDLLVAEGGVPEATAAVNEFADSLRDPALVSGFATLTSGLVTATSAAIQFATGVALGAKRIAELYAELRHGPDTQFGQLNQEMERLVERRRNLLQSITTAQQNADSTTSSVLRRSFDTTAARARDQLTEVEARMNEISEALLGIQRQEVAMAASAPRPATSSSPGSIDEDPIGAIFDTRQMVMAEQQRRVADRVSTGIERLFQTTLDFVDAELDSVELHYEETVSSMSVYAEQAARNMQDHFADFLFDPFDNGLKGMLKGFADTIRRMLAEAAAAKIFETLFGGGASGSPGSNFLGSFLGGIFGGSRDSGGHGEPGKTYLIGTGAQPELFTPSSAGTFTPNAGGVAVNNTYHIQSGVTRQELIPALEATRRQTIADVTGLIRGGAFA